MEFNPFKWGKEAKRVADIDPKVEKYFEQENAQKNLASEAMAEKKENFTKLKDIKDSKTLAMIEFLEKYPNWAERFGELTNDSKISAETMNLVLNEMKNPNLNYFFDEKKNEGFYETIQMKEFREAKDEFMGKFGAKLKIWEAKGFTADTNELVKAYMKDKDLDLITTEDNKIGWGTPAAGYEFSK